MRTRFIIPLVLLTLSCAVVPRTKEVPETPVVLKEDLLTEIRSLEREDDYRELRRKAQIWLGRFGEEPEADEVRLYAGAASMELGFHEEAETILSALVDRERPDRYVLDARLLLAEIHQATGDYLQSAERALSVLAADADGPHGSRAAGELAESVQLLSAEQLDLLIERHGYAPGADIVLRGRLLFAEAARDTAAVREITEQLAELGTEIIPPEEEVDERMLVPAPAERREGEPPRYRIGLLCPMGGRYAPIGEAFVQGASLALKEGRQRGITDVEIVVGDTRASSLTAHRVASRLIDDEGTIALVGGVLSSPTIAAAQVAEYRRTLLFSPIATEPGIGAVGKWIYQTTNETEAEVIAIARVACGELDLERIAFLSVDDPARRRLELLFRQEVERWGGITCGAEFYREGSTDFHEHIERIRNEAPEALFIASDTEDLILILPQLSFYEFGVQLLGTSAWNSKRLLRMAGRDMEGAIFPAEVAERRDEEHFLTAAVLVDEPIGDVNRFTVGGYVGIRTILEAIAAGGGDRETLHEAMERLLDDRRHSYLDLIAGSGITMYIVRGGRIESFLTLEGSP